ncbi:hypothetical protein [Phocaeicola vulgatus]|nr:hypothetical protein [Phocaeicola vulgatus]MBT9851875.1 hypothetical protein [Phocaeicola vulgatus]
MSDLNLENIVGFKAVDKNGNERQVTVDEMTELVSARIVSAASEISTFAAAAAAGTDEFEDQLPQSDTFSWLRTLDGSKNPTLTSSSAAAKVLGGLLQNGNYIRMAEGKGSATLYRIDFMRDLNLVVKIVGEGNSEVVDDYSIICMHGGGNGLCITHNSGPSSIRMYRDNDYNYYVYVSGWGYAIAYFANRIPIYNAISATKVDIDIRTLEQVGI